jgi:ligand-binding sensor domain-containing protein
MSSIWKEYQSKRLRAASLGKAVLTPAIARGEPISAFRHLDFFSCILALVLIGLLVFLFLGGQAAAGRLGLFPPMLEEVKDLRLAADYRQADAGFVGMARLGDRLILGSEGAGLQSYKMESGSNGVWQPVSSFPGSQVSDLTALDDQLLVVSGGGVLRGDAQLQNWRTLVGTNGLKPFASSADAADALLSPDGQVLYVATRQDGLGEYDTTTHNWRVLNQNSPDLVLLGNTVHTLQTGAGLLFVGTSQGLSVFELASASPQRIQRRRLDLELAAHDVREIHLAGNSVWLLTAQGGVALRSLEQESSPASPGGWRTIVGDNGFTAMGDKPPAAAAVLQFQDRLWIAAPDAGIGIYDLKSRDWQVYTTQNGLSSNVVTRLVTQAEQVWAATDNGLDVYDETQNSWHNSYAFGQKITQLKVFSGDVWAVTESGEAAVRRAGSLLWQTVAGPGLADGSLNFSQIQTLASYNERLWLGFSGFGVGVYEPGAHSWQAQNDGLPPISSSNFIELKALGSQLWARVGVFSTTGRLPGPGQAYLWDGSRWQAQVDLSDIVSMEYDGHTPWFLTAAGQLVDIGSNTRYFAGGLPAGAAIYTAVREGNKLYLGMNTSDIWVYDLALHNWTDLSRPNAVGYIHSLYLDGERLWYTTSRGELGVYDLLTGKDTALLTGSLSPGANGSSAPGSSVITHLAWFQDHAWFVTQDGRLYEYDPAAAVTSLRKGSDENGVPTRVEQVRAGQEELWCLVTHRLDNRTWKSLEYLTSAVSGWQDISTELGHDVQQFAVNGDLLWYVNADGSIYVFSGKDKTVTSYFGGEIPGSLGAVLSSVLDRQNRLWFVFETGKAAVYTPSLHQWQTLKEMNDARFVVSLPVSKTEEIIYIGGASGVFAYRSAAAGIAAIPQSVLPGVQQLLRADNHVWSLLADNHSTSANAVQWRSDSGSNLSSPSGWKSGLGGSGLSGTPGGLVDPVNDIQAAGTQVRVLYASGLLRTYDTTNHQWRSMCQDSSPGKMIDQAFTRDDIWVLSEKHNLYRVNYSASLSSCYFQAFAGTADNVSQIEVTDSAVWTRTAQGTVALLPTKEVVSGSLRTVTTADPSNPEIIVLGGPGEASLNIIPSGAFLPLEVPAAYYLAHGVLLGLAGLIGLWLAIAVIRGIKQADAPGWERAARIIGGVLIFLAFAAGGLVGQTRLQAPEKDLLSVQRATLPARSIAAYQNDIWVATDQGIWRFDYQPQGRKLILHQRYTRSEGLLSDQITSLAAANGKLYARLPDGSWQQFTPGVWNASCWQAVQPIPDGQAVQDANGWNWTLKGGKLAVQVAAGSDFELQQGMLPFEQPESIAVNGGSLWSVTGAFLAEYAYTDSGALSFKRLFEPGQAGLPADPIQRCLSRDKVLYCQAGGQVFSLTGSRWLPYASVSPFEEQQTIFDDPGTGLQVTAGLEKVSINPASLGQSAGFRFDRAQDIAFTQARLWIKTAQGAWEADPTANLKLLQLHPPGSQVESLFSRVEEQTWSTADQPWQWTRKMDFGTGVETVQISLPGAPGIARPFFSSDTDGNFADLIARDVLVENTQPGKQQAVWIAAAQGVWRAAYDPDSGKLVRAAYDPLGGASVERLALQAGAVYALTSGGQVLQYDPAQSGWQAASRDIFPEHEVVFSDPLTGLEIVRSNGRVEMNSLTADTNLPGQQKFAFDQVVDAAAQDGVLWLATRAGILRGQTGAGDVRFDRLERPSGELPLTSVQSILIDAVGTRYAQALAADGSPVYLQSVGETWQAAPFANTPFSVSETRLAQMPGLLEWRQNGGAFSAFLDSTPVTFQDGKFSFDRAWDVWVENGNVFLLTAGGLLRYQDGVPLTFRRLEAEKPPGEIRDLVQTDAGLVSRDAVGYIFQLVQGGWKSITFQARDYPFTQPALVFSAEGWKQVSQPDFSTYFERLQVAVGLPGSLFASSGKFSSDMVQYLAVGSQQAWLATQGGLFAYAPRTESMRRVSPAGLPSSLAGGLAFDGTRVYLKVSPGVFQFDANSASWAPVSGKDEFFAARRILRWTGGQWQESRLPADSGEAVLGVTGAAADYPLFDASGKFSFDVIQAVRGMGGYLWLGTRGGLLQARFAPDSQALQYLGLILHPANLPGLEISRLELDSLGNLWMLGQGQAGVWNPAGQPVGESPFQVLRAQFQSPALPYPVELRFVQGQGMELWLNGKIYAEYDQSPGILTWAVPAVPLKNCLGFAQDANYLWVATPQTLVMVRKGMLTAFLSAHVPAGEPSPGQPR